MNYPKQLKNLTEEDYKSYLKDWQEAIDYNHYLKSLERFMLGWVIILYTILILLLY